jgi:predicted nucleic acid-binding protein
MAVPEVFADTAGWANYFVRSQSRHAAAKELLVRSRAGEFRVVTTSYVLAELISLLTSPLRTPRPLLITILDAIKSARWVEIVHIDRVLDEKHGTC